MPTAKPKAAPKPKAEPSPAFAKDDAVVPGGMFGAISLNVGGKGFVMQTKKGELVYKLPAERVAALTVSGGGIAWDPGHGRAMKEWVSVLPERVDVVALGKEAKAFVGKGS